MKNYYSFLSLDAIQSIHTKPQLILIKKTYLIPDIISQDRWTPLEGPPN